MNKSNADCATHRICFLGAKTKSFKCKTPLCPIVPSGIAFLEKRLYSSLTLLARAVDFSNEDQANTAIGRGENVVFETKDQDPKDTYRINQIKFIVSAEYMPNGEHPYFLVSFRKIETI